ncbi:hypothetical protein PYCC9005_002352 [Savitreella phatthalungensis]
MLRGALPRRITAIRTCSCVQRRQFWLTKRLALAWKPSPPPSGQRAPLPDEPTRAPIVPPSSSSRAIPITHEEPSNPHHQKQTQPRYTPGEASRGRGGVVVAIGITAVNGYVWWQWQLAAADVRGDRPDTRRAAMMTDHFTCSVRNWDQKRYHTLLTSGFSHIQLWHILANTIAVLSFFPAVSLRLGVIRTLTAYIGSIAGGSAASLYAGGAFNGVKEREKAQKAMRRSALDWPGLAMSPDELKRRQAQIEQAARGPTNPIYKDDVPGLGASGGVFGLFTIAMLLNPTLSVSVFFIPLPAYVAWGVLVGVDAYCSINTQGRKQLAQLTGIQLGHEAHLGGTAAGIASAILLNPRFWLGR